MRRREFIAVVGGAATAWPLGVRAQRAEKIPRIGWIILGSPAGGFADIFSYYDSFRAGLHDLGYVEGSNIILIARSALGVPESLPDLIDELLRENVSVIVSPGPAIRAVREKVKSIPVIFAFSGDPVAAGFVEKVLKVGSRNALSLLIEGFNLLNRKNVKNVSNVSGAAFGTSKVAERVPAVCAIAS